MLTDLEIIDGYRYFLGRVPENEDVIAALRARCRSLDELRAAFVMSTEFQACLPGARAKRAKFSKPLDWPPIDVEHRISDDAIKAMLAHIEQNWNMLGISEPHWSVISDENFRASQIHENEQNFFDSGKDAVRLLNAALARANLSPGDFKSCFELGCGLGRLTCWLARQFSNVIAMDISPSHLHLARGRAAAENLSNIDFRRLTSLDAIAALPPYDAFVSIIVLQHNPPPVIAAMLRAILTKLEAGGVAYFQLSTYHKHYSFEAQRYLDGLASDGSIEMHVLPQDALFALLNESGCDLLEIREDAWTGQADGISNTLLVRKRKLPGLSPGTSP